MVCLSNISMIRRIMTREWAANDEISFPRNLAKGFSQTDNSLQSKSLLAIFKTMESWNKNSMWYNRNFNQNFFTYWQEKNKSEKVGRSFYGEKLLTMKI